MAMHLAKDKSLIILLVAAILMMPQVVCARGRGLSSGPAHVSGHMTRRGSYVKPHQRTAPDSTKLNNWSTRGNLNPYTGKRGSKKAY